MAKKKPVRKPVNDPALLRTGLTGLDELTRLIRQLAVDSDSRAVHGDPNAYLDLQHLLREVRTLADSGKSAFVTDVSNTTPEKLSENCRIALTLGNYAVLHGQCGTCITTIDGWQPAPSVENTRAPLLIGTREEVREKRARLTEEYFNDPARVADREGQEAIHSALNRVLKTLNAMSSSLRKMLVGQGSGEHSKGRSWRQKELDEAIKEYRQAKDMEFRILKKAIADEEPKAIDKAQKVFGRNSIRDVLNVRAQAMVSKSPEWQSLADELGIPRKSVSKGKLLPSQRDRAVNDPNDEMARVLEIIRDKLSGEQMDEVRQKFEAGEMSPSEALVWIESQKKT